MLVCIEIHVSIENFDPAQMKMYNQGEGDTVIVFHALDVLCRNLFT